MNCYKNSLNIPPRNLTWIPKMAIFKRAPPFPRPIILAIHVSLPECQFPIVSWGGLVDPSSSPIHRGNTLQKTVEMKLVAWEIEFLASKMRS